MGVGIISAGRVGAVIGNALRATGHQITGTAAVSEESRERAELLLPGVPILDPPTIVERSELVILAVPDDALAALAEGLASAKLVPGAQIFAHTSGRYGVDVLAPLARAGAITLALHPAMTFTGTSIDLKRLVGCPWAITAPAMFAPIARALVEELDGTSFDVAEADRGQYHLALAHGSNHLVVLVSQVLDLLRDIGISDPAQLAAPLMNAALEEALRSGPAALTGPIRRGDSGTIVEHLGALAESDRYDIERAYRALGAAAVELTNHPLEVREHLTHLLKEKHRD